MVKKALIIIPTYNERERLEELVYTILKLKTSLELNVLIIDDNSPDGMGEMADKLKEELKNKLFVIHRAEKLGMGTAYKEGFKFALSHNYEYIFQMDADFSHHPDYIPKFLEKINSYDLIIGSRFYKGRVSVVNWPLKRLILSQIRK